MEMEVEYDKEDARPADSVPPTRIPLVRATTRHPIIELELEYEDDAAVAVQVSQTNERKRPDLAKNGKAKAARSKARKKKPARRRKA